jgi:hypothetical protein
LRDTSMGCSLSVQWAGTWTAMMSIDCYQHHKRDWQYTHISNYRTQLIQAVLKIHYHWFFIVHMWGFGVDQFHMPPANLHSLCINCFPSMHTHMKSIDRTPYSRTCWCMILLARAGTYIWNCG